MDIDTIVKYAMGFVSGGFVVKLFDWWADKNKSEKQRRRDQIAAWRTWLATAPVNGGWASGGVHEQMILRSAEFQSLEPHLDEDLIARLRKSRTMMVGFDFQRTVAKQINKLEKKWGLI
jgi:hypothetical protein